MRSLGPTGLAVDTALLLDSGQTEPFACGATPEDQSLLVPHLKERWLDLGFHLQEAGEPVEYIYFPYFPHQGMVSLLAVMPDGQGIETATVGSEGVVGAMSGFRLRWWPRVFRVRRASKIG